MNPCTNGSEGMFKRICTNQNLTCRGLNQTREVTFEREDEPEKQEAEGVAREDLHSLCLPAPSSVVWRSGSMAPADGRVSPAPPAERATQHAPRNNMLLLLSQGEGRSEERGATAMSAETRRGASGGCRDRRRKAMWGFGEGSVRADRVWRLGFPPRDARFIPSW